MNSTDNLEYQFIQTQLRCNQWVIGVMENEITQLMTIIHQKRQAMKEIHQMTSDLQARIDSMPHDNRMVFVDYTGLPHDSIYRGEKKDNENDTV